MHVDRAIDPPASLAEWNAAGYIDAVDVHVAATLARIATRTGGQVDGAAELAMACASRAPRSGHACVDLARADDAITPPPDVDTDDDVPEPPAWPGDARQWLASVRRTGLATDAARVGADLDAALVIDGTRLYLRRHHRDEQAVARGVRALVAAPSTRAPQAAGAVLDRLFGPESRTDPQRRACERSLEARLTVLAGGPGTGKTYTVTRLVAAHLQVAAMTGEPSPRIALAAPTGKAAARLDEAIRDGVEDIDADPTVRTTIAELSASTVHRLLGRARGSRVRPRHDANAPLEVDLVVVDEASMVSLALMARLLDALPSWARLVLIGDPNQLQSVEAGTVLGDVLGPRADGGASGPLAERVVLLTRPRRFGAGSATARLADAVRRSAAEEAIAVLEDGHTDDVRWVSTDAATDPLHALDEHIRPLLHAVAERQVAAGRRGDAVQAAAANADLQVLCAHRRGPAGVTGLTARIERWLYEDGLIRHDDEWYPGRPVLLTRNDHRRSLYNGDSGVVLATGTGPHLAVPGPRGTRRIAASRVGDVETAWAVTIHKSQGSQYDHVVVVLPDAGSRLLTHELLYTAITRARSRVTIVGSRAALVRGIERRVTRVGGLRAALWE